MSKRATVLDSQNIVAEGNTLSNTILQSIDQQIIRTNPTREQLIDTSINKFGVMPTSNAALFVGTDGAYLTLSGSEGGTWYTAGAYAPFDNGSYIDLADTAYLKCKTSLNQIKDADDVGLQTKLDSINGSNLSISGYTKGSSTAALAATDTVNAALAKLENKVDSKTSNVGTITGIKMNGSSKGSSGVVDLGTVLTSHQSLAGYLPLSGGTMTGEITRSGIAIRTTDESSSVSINGGTSDQTGSYVRCFGINHTTYPGQLVLAARKKKTDTTSDPINFILNGETQSLKWNNQNIVRTINGLTANDNGDVSLTNSYLPLSGGTMTGTIKRSGDVIKNSLSTSFTRINSSTDISSGGYMIGYGQGYSTTNLQGAIELVANKVADGSRKYTLLRVEQPGNIILGSTASTTVTIAKNNSTGSLFIEGGTSQTNGAIIKLFGNSASTTYPGAAQIVVTDSSGTSRYFTLNPNGNATWNGKTFAYTTDVTNASRYSLVTSTGTLTDLAINKITPTAAINVTFPSAVSNKSRDFAVRIEMGSTLYSVNFPSTGYTFEGDEFPTLTTNTNYLICFTETKSNVFFVRSFTL